MQLLHALAFSVLLVLAIASCIIRHETLNKTDARGDDFHAHISVPFHYQIKKYYCGPAALEMVFDYYGEDVSQVEIADVARTHPNTTYIDELRRAAYFSDISRSLGEEMSTDIAGYSARESGYAAFEYWNLTIVDLKTLIDDNSPAIVVMWYDQLRNDTHYRVVVGYSDTNILMHDPWNKSEWGGTYGGSDVSMAYATFLDLWNVSNYYWGLWVRPWNIELQVPNTINKGENFTATANITFPCPPPFNTYARMAFHCNVSITLSECLALASGEATRDLGEINTGNVVQTSWSIHAIENGSPSISVAAIGMIEDTVSEHENGSYAHYSYQDAIGGSSTISISVIPEFTSFFILPLFMVATLLAIIVYGRRQKKGS